MKTVRTRTLISAAALSATALVLASCGSGPGTGGGPGGTGGDDAGDGPQTVRIYGTIVDTEAALLEQSWADWEEQSGIDIVYEGSQEFEAQIGIRAQGGNPPDLAFFPQPGLFSDLAARGHLVPASDTVATNVAEYWNESWATYLTVGDELYGAPLMANVKGWIWYNNDAFQEHGWEIPDDWDGLLDLSDEIAADTGGPAWCVGFGSDAATGWPGTDWIEDIVLRESGTDVYDQWVVGEIPFTDDSIKSAFEHVGEILLNPERVNAGFGGVESIDSTAFGDVANPLVSGDCVLTHQASFLEGFIIDAGGEVSEDGDVWAFMQPPMSAGDDPAITGGGELVGAFNDNPATIAVQEYLSSPEWANSRVGLGGVVSANSGLDPSLASSPILEQSVELLQDPDTVFRFDGSDLMPGTVGAGTFWEGMRSWVGGTDLDSVLRQIDSGWPDE
ncbi:ABC transporter substrate-binding protein [Microbacterium amylolyticum]|uniref:Alpha-glucoside transport system substrate-binding protein n=1 Tax=Microbacterium amylolyticum TaxID=936337 RepID=A0ABS4ZJE7_9MICO|nr:ABC transporter substrate-binding protein [Microbacterium amylolyticum]MBP2437163.1 alpha-glucoside transport system substrate-binding protein [Microbacterium amylolyticum]